MPLVLGVHKAVVEVARDILHGKDCCAKDYRLTNCHTERQAKLLESQVLMRVCAWHQGKVELNGHGYKSRLSDSNLDAASCLNDYAVEVREVLSVFD